MKSNKILSWIFSSHTKDKLKDKKVINFSVLRHRAPNRETSRNRQNSLRTKALMMHKISIKMSRAREAKRLTRPIDSYTLVLTTIATPRHMRWCANVCICGCAKYVRWPREVYIFFDEIRYFSPQDASTRSIQTCRYTPQENFWEPMRLCLWPACCARANQFLLFSRRLHIIRWEHLFVFALVNEASNNRFKSFQELDQTC